MKTTVMHVIDHLGYGGAPTVVKNIVENMKDDSVENIVCALRKNPRPLPVSAETVDLDSHKFDPFTCIKIARLARKRNIDIIHAHLQKSILSALVASFFCGSKVIIHEHGPVFRGGTGCFYRLGIRMLRSRVTHAIANSAAAKRALQRASKIDGDFISVVENFIDSTRFDPERYDRIQSRKKLKISNEAMVIGFVGRLDRCKGVDILLNAARTLLACNRGYRFVIVGYGAEEHNLRRLARELAISEQVTFTGLCENPAAAMAAFDLAVIPSRREAFGITAVELMAMGVPVIASTVGGLPELIENERTGLLLAELNPEQIAAAVKKLASDPDLRTTLAENARNFAKQFDGTRQIEELRQIYRTISSPDN